MQPEDKNVQPVPSKPTFFGTRSYCMHTPKHHCMQHIAKSQTWHCYIARCMWSKLHTEKTNVSDDLPASLFKQWPGGKERHSDVLVVRLIFALEHRERAEVKAVVAGKENVRVRLLQLAQLAQFVEELVEEVIDAKQCLEATSVDVVHQVCLWLAERVSPLDNPMLVFRTVVEVWISEKPTIETRREDFLVLVTIFVLNFLHCQKQKFCRFFVHALTILSSKVRKTHFCT